MRTVTLEVSSRKETNRRFLRAFEGQPQGELITFETPALLFKVLTQKRWELLAALTGAGLVSLREAARRVGPPSWRQPGRSLPMSGVGSLRS